MNSKLEETNFQCHLRPGDLRGKSIYPLSDCFSVKENGELAEVRARGPAQDQRTLGFLRNLEVENCLLSDFGKTHEYLIFPHPGTLKTPHVLYD